MDGKNHLAAGVIFAASGLMVTNAPLQEVAIPLIIGGISGLAPDLDHHNSLLIKRVSKISNTVIPLILVSALGFLAFRLYEANYSFGVVSISSIIGLAIIIGFQYFYFKKLTAKQSILVGGFVMAALGAFTSLLSLVLTGLFLICASQLKHRGLTHSLYFLAFWSFICWSIQYDTNIQYIWASGTLGYLSHLITDHWFTKRKIKWLKASEFKQIKKKLKLN